MYFDTIVATASALCLSAPGLVTTLHALLRIPYHFHMHGNITIQDPSSPRTQGRIYTDPNPCLT
jgi:hypothetical protein